MKLVALVVVITLMSAILTGLVRRYALRSRLLDVPNERSMHNSPTPRGGGLAIVITFLGGALVLAFWGHISFDLAVATIPAGALVAAMGWYDDRHTLSNRVRMLLWFPAAFWALYWLGGLPAVDLGILEIRLGAAGYLVGAVGIVWLLNLYNFMDGTDGLAATQAVMACLAASAILWMSGSPSFYSLPLLLGAACAGFLVWNWPPAKIFMGDVASGFIGFVIAVLAIHSENERTIPLAIWAVLLAVFLVDATFTVARRMKNREPWSQPHRSHAYQVQARIHSHRRVLLGFILIELALVGLAAIAFGDPRTIIPILAIVVGALALSWRKLSKDPEIEAEHPEG